MGKSAKSCSIIGGYDGPTSIFIADATYPYYSERRRSMKYARIQRERPKLLGECNFMPPEYFSDEQAVKEWQQKIDDITEEIFSTDYHLFIINKGEQGKLEIEIDTFYPAISVSYSGNKKVMEPILKDIHTYYGVLQDDIDNKTDRYKMLLTILRSW